MYVHVNEDGKRSNLWTWVAIFAFYMYVHTNEDGNHFCDTHPSFTLVKGFIL